MSLFLVFSLSIQNKAQKYELQGLFSPRRGEVPPVLQMHFPFRSVVKWATQPRRQPSGWRSVLALRIPGGSPHRQFEDTSLWGRQSAVHFERTRLNPPPTAGVEVWPLPADAGRGLGAFD